LQRIDPVKNQSNGLAPDARPLDSVEFQRFLDHVADLDRGGPGSLRSWMDLAEAWQITRALERCQGNRSATARALGIGRRTLYAKMERLGISASLDA